MPDALLLNLVNLVLEQILYLFSKKVQRKSEWSLPPFPHTGMASWFSVTLHFFRWSSSKLSSCHFAELRGKLILATQASQGLESYPPVTIFIWIKEFKTEWIIFVLEIQVKVQRCVAASKIQPCLVHVEQRVFNPGCTSELPKECQKY